MLGRPWCGHREGEEAGDLVTEGNADLDGFGHVFGPVEPVQLVHPSHALAIADNHAYQQAAKQGDVVSLADADDGGVNVIAAALRQ